MYSLTALSKVYTRLCVQFVHSYNLELTSHVLVILYHMCCRNPTTGGWRAVKLVDGTLHPPSKEGWGGTTYVVVVSVSKPTSDPNGSDAETAAAYPTTSAPSVGELSLPV